MEAQDPALAQTCVHTAQLLRAAAKQKGFYHPDVRSLRLQLRQAYETFLLQDYTAAKVALLSNAYCCASLVMSGACQHCSTAMKLTFGLALGLPTGSLLAHIRWYLPPGLCLRWCAA